MMPDEDYRVKKAKGTSIRAFFPILGLILMIAFGAVAYITGPLLTDTALNNNLISIPNDQIDAFDWISRAIVFMVMLLVTALLYAMAAPKPKRLVTERGLDKERKERIKAEEEAKKRKKRAQHKMAEARRKEAEKNK